MQPYDMCMPIQSFDPQANMYPCLDIIRIRKLTYQHLATSKQQRRTSPMMIGKLFPTKEVSCLFPLHLPLEMQKNYFSWEWLQKIQLPKPAIVCSRDGIISLLLWMRIKWKVKYIGWNTPSNSEWISVC